MKIGKYILGLCLGAAIAVSCENDPYEWEGEAYAKIVGPEIWTLGTDSMIFTFSTQGMDVTSFTVNAEMQLIGVAADADRSVVVKIDEKGTTATSDMYSLSNTVVVPAGEVSAAFPVVINRTAALTQKVYRLKISLTDEGDIKRGVGESNDFTIIFSDIIAKPANWDSDLVEFFGTYSDTKYRFIIETTGVTEFPYGQGMSWGQMYNYRLVMVNALNEYNATHSTPMTDENNALVTF